MYNYPGSLISLEKTDGNRLTISAYKIRGVVGDGDQTKVIVELVEGIERTFTVKQTHDEVDKLWRTHIPEYAA